MSIIYNTFRKDKYLRTLFTQGRYLLASENSDLELEVFDFIRQSFKNNIGNVAIESAWQVSVYSTTQLLIAPGEAWYDGLPFTLAMGDDWLLTPGITPAGITLSYAPNGAGILATFTNTTTPSAKYRIVINASEQIITSTQDPFLQNINVPEPTASKTRLVYTVNIVLDSLQGTSPNYDQSSPTPYVGEVGAYNAVNLSNTIQINPSSSSGYLISIIDVSGSQEIDGRSCELTIANPSGANPFPVGATDQGQFENGTFYDANGSEYHINAIFNSTTANQVVIRLSNQVGQADPVIPNVSGSPTGFLPYYIQKQDIYYTDDTTGIPTGVVHWHIAQATWDTNNGFVHPSVVTDLRNRIVSEQEFELLTNEKFNLTLTGGGVISFASDGQTLSWTAPFVLVNPAGPTQTIAFGSAVLVNDGTLTYLLNNSGGTISKGIITTNVVSNSGSVVSFANSPTPNLGAVSLGNVIQVGNQTTYITAINNATISGTNPNVTVTVASPITNTGAATIYLDSYGPATVNLNENTYVLAALNNGNLVVNKTLVLGPGQSNTVYDVVISYPTGLAANTPITLPNNPITGLPQYYNTGSYGLQVYLNQLYKTQGVDWTALSTSTLSFNYALQNNAQIHLRLETFPSGLLGGGNSGNTLQTAYNNGSTIVMTTGVPFTVSGPGPSVADFQGNITITGVIL